MIKIQIKLSVGSKTKIPTIPNTFKVFEEG